MKIISGGQTGVDRAALDVALELGLPCGGWCPKGRRSEAGPIPERYPLEATATADYPERTEANVRAADATLILTRGRPDRGTALTYKLALRLKKPCYVVDLKEPDVVEQVKMWLANQRIAVLNVAGPRESSQKGIHAEASAYLRRVLA
ncbi:MAG TPA: putative molybdenum carrier protein [Gemmataceae bacterium]|nr:putative molybdenum carrier protein [Gemmataceae bacterium]